MQLRQTVRRCSSSSSRRRLVARLTSRNYAARHARQGERRLWRDRACVRACVSTRARLAFNDKLIENVQLLLLLPPRSWFNICNYCLPYQRLVYGMGGADGADRQLSWQFNEPLEPSHSCAAASAH